MNRVPCCAVEAIRLYTRMPAERVERRAIRLRGEANEWSGRRIIGMDEFAMEELAGSFGFDVVEPSGETAENLLGRHPGWSGYRTEFASSCWVIFILAYGNSATQHAVVYSGGEVRDQWSKKWRKAHASNRLARVVSILYLTPKERD